MRALFYIQESNYGNLRDLFPATHPWMIKIANKPALEYLLDFAILNGCTEMRFIMEEPDSEVRDSFSDGSRWGCRFSYSSGKAGDAIDQILEKNSAFCSDKPLLIFNGLFFIHYHKELQYQTWHDLLPSELMMHCSSGALIFCRSSQNLRNISHLTNEVDFSLSRIQSTQDIFNLTMKVLQSEQDHYVLPGYGPEKNILIGRNVEIGSGVQLNPPVVIGDDVQLHANAVIGPNAVICNEVIIGKEAILTDSIIMDRTYLANELKVHDKMINGSIVYSSHDDVWMNMGDDVLFHQLESPRPLSLLQSLGNRIAAALLLLAMSLPWLLLRVAGSLDRKRPVQTESCFQDAGGKTFLIPQESPNLNSFAGRLYSALSLHKVSHLTRVITGKLSLVGNRPIQSKQENFHQLQIMTAYTPGAFYYTEAENLIPGSEEEEIAERFYAVFSNPQSKLKVVGIVIFNNLKSITNKKILN